MFKIRKHIFETNSSSSDCYDDFDGPDTAQAYQTIHVQIQYTDGLSEDEMMSIIERLVDELNNDTCTDVFDGVYDLFEDGDIIDGFDVIDSDELSFDMRVTATIAYEGKYYPATRYEPAEYPEPYISECDCMPGKLKDFKGKEDIKADILKKLKEHGYTQIVKVVDIYGDDVDDDEFYDNIQ